MTATLGNSVYLGTKSSATASKSATAEAIQLAQDQGDTEALASDEYKNAATDEAKNAIKQKYEAKYIHAAIAAMDKDGISAGVTNYDTDYTYGNDSSCNYAGSQADGIVTVGSKDATRRIQNVSAGLVGPNSTDAVNGSQLYALTRQMIRTWWPGAPMKPSPSPAAAMLSLPPLPMARPPTRWILQS